MLLPNKLNILYVGTLPPHPGGTAIMCSQLIIALSKLGHKVRAVAPITDGTLQSEDPFARRYPKIKTARYKVPYFQISPYSDLSDDFRKLEGERIQEILRDMVAKELPDIVIIGRESFAWHVPDIANAYCLPCVLLVHGPTTLYILNRTFPESLGQRLIMEYRKIDLIVLMAKHSMNVFQQLMLTNIRLIPNAVDLSRFRPRPKDNMLLKELAIEDDEIVISHVSNLKDVKRPMNIISSAERCIRQNPNLVYVIVGDGPLRRKMEDVCEQKQILKKFRFVGWVDHDRVPDYVNLADIVVMPSEIETQALVYLETQACARLLLASDIPGAREVIVNRETGLLFRKGDIDDLTSKTLLAAGDPKLRADIGRKARERVQAHSLTDVVVAYAATLKEVIQQHRRS